MVFRTRQFSGPALQRHPSVTAKSTTFTWLQLFIGPGLSTKSWKAKELMDAEWLQIKTVNRNRCRKKAHQEPLSSWPVGNLREGIYNLFVLFYWPRHRNMLYLVICPTVSHYFVALGFILASKYFSPKRISILPAPVLYLGRWFGQAMSAVGSPWWWLLFLGSIRVWPLKVMRN